MLAFRRTGWPRSEEADAVNKFWILKKFLDEVTTGNRDLVKPFDPSEEGRAFRIVVREQLEALLLPWEGQRGATATPAFRETEHLERLLADWGTLRVGGLRARTVPIEQLYVPLKLGGRSERTTAMGALEGLGVRETSLADHLPSRCLAILGDPGAGNTTLMSHLATSLVSHILGRSTSEYAAALGEPTPTPVLMRATWLAGALLEPARAPEAAGTAAGDDAARDHAFSATREAWAGALAALWSEAGIAVSVEDGLRLLDQGGFLFIVDGLDEVSEAKGLPGNNPVHFGRRCIPASRLPRP